MVKAIVVHETGGPEVLKWEDIDLPAPGRGEIRLKMRATGVNFQDINIRYGRWGFTSPRGFPYIPGSEGVGVVTAIGPGVNNFSVGQRVGFAASGGRQSYAQEMNVKTLAAIPVPDSISDEVFAATMLKGQTAHMLVAQVYKLRAGETALIHGASGAIGTILCQWAKHIGATVIGTVGSAEKVPFAKAHGCDHVLVLSEGSLSKRVRELTKGRGVAVVYDGVGQAVLDESLASLALRGMMVTYGQTSGPAPACDPSVLMKTSLYFTRPMLHDFILNTAELLAASQAVFDVITAGHVKVEICKTYPLAEAAQAHRDKEARTTLGSSILISD